MAKIESKRLNKPLANSDDLMEKLSIDHFDLNAILRGAQLTIVGALRALRNPQLFTSKHYKQAALAVLAGVIIRLAIEIPIFGVKVFLWFVSFVVDLGASTFDDKVVEGLDLIQNHVLQVPFFLMSILSRVTPTLDNMFMMSLAFVDETYYEKHKGEDRSTLRNEYYPNLRRYPKKDGTTHKTSTAENMSLFLMKFGKKAGLSLAVYALSYVPILGRFVLPAASFYTFNKAAGLGPGLIVFGTGIFLPRKYLVIFLQSYFSSRSLMRELLEPYFARIKFTKEQKKNWFHDREGLLFGFGIGFYILLRIPLLGVLVYGIAEASTAYLITKITDPPPPVGQEDSFAASQQKWKNKHEFLNLKLDQLDALNTPSTKVVSQGVSDEKASSSATEVPSQYSELISR
ncbi:formamidase [Sclerotinia borealis F-4128]|uniref:Formamidase n=1 Tax=Sclerotinia borealis (strain F-4128) TaxID=1432307 RepID=W9CJK5_SCLBF|nr:formamidase [Sclerotinia borealis F-4128]